MKKRIITLFAALALGGAALAPQSARAQDYQTAIGVNLGDIMGVNFKQFLSDRSAVEADFGYQFSSNGISLTAIYQYHIPLVDQFKLYVGGGLNIGVSHLHRGGAFALGIDPQVGFEYTFQNAPIVLAVDYQPQINFFTPMRWGVAGFKIRFKI